jgi:hypothetical protein
MIYLPYHSTHHTWHRLPTRPQAPSHVGRRRATHPARPQHPQALHAARLVRAVTSRESHTQAQPLSHRTPSPISPTHKINRRVATGVAVVFTGFQLVLRTDYGERDHVFKPVRRASFFNPSYSSNLSIDPTPPPPPSTDPAVVHGADRRVAGRGQRGGAAAQGAHLLAGGQPAGEGPEGAAEAAAGRRRGQGAGERAGAGHVRVGDGGDGATTTSSARSSVRGERKWWRVGAVV